MISTAALVKRGRTYDYEDSRTTHRMHTMLTILAGAGIKPTIVHGPQVGWDWATSRERHIEACTLNGSGTAGCTITWPAWVTDEMFDAAWRFAETTISAQGAYNRSR